MRLLRIFSILCLLQPNVVTSQIPAFDTEYDSAAIASFLDSMAVFYDSVEATIEYQQGRITLADGAATLHVQDGYKFISAAQSQYIMSELYGNPDDPTIAGILMPEELGVTYGEGFMFVIYYRESGFVNDHSNGDLDDPALMDVVHKNDLEENRMRVNAGLETFKMIGWARHPAYDKNNHILSWARELKFDSDIESNTLNYNILVLGRKGFIVLNAIATMNDLQAVNKAFEMVPSMIEFNEGYRYSDFDAATDVVSPWTLNGLVAGSTEIPDNNKSNNFKLIAILIAVAAVGIFVYKSFQHRKKNLS